MVEEGPRQNTTLIEEIQLCTNWDDVTCPICLDFPHNSVLLQCSSYDKGCRPFVCDTDHLHSNCLDRFKEANGMLSGSQSPSSADNIQFLDSGPDSKPACPLCRGEVTGWIVVDKARVHLDVKNRCCEEAKCSFTGTYLELQKHAQVEHPHACPSKIDPARQLDWENFQQSSEIIDVLSTIHSEVPHGVVLGDYVIEYGMITGMMTTSSVGMRETGGRLVYYIRYLKLLGHLEIEEGQGSVLPEEETAD
ncbi:UNVERIFIED_CONTAM: hypothetical protein Sangu_1842500 [Sesamum angustifolium]|uniref:Uncharacterized protein n=1 Tax=Sesamum angustifolium TaxID=2727405 RepID=A0AAW2M8C2_9LAMI